MKFCVYCGKELIDEALFCSNCGNSTDLNINPNPNPFSNPNPNIIPNFNNPNFNPNFNPNYNSNFNPYLNQGWGIRPKTNSGLKTAAKVFFIIGTIINSFLLFFIPLMWCVPMAIYYFTKVENNEEVGVGFKVCTLLFVSFIAGILMIADNDTKN